MLNVQCSEHLEDARKFAKEFGREEQLQKELDYLAVTQPGGPEVPRGPERGYNNPRGK
jgi:hypothetical protein